MVMHCSSFAIIVLTAITLASSESGVCDTVGCDVEDHVETVSLLQTSFETSGVRIDLSAGSSMEEEQKVHEQGRLATTDDERLNLRAVIAEFIAMTLFVIIGCGSAMGVAKVEGSAWVLQVALTFGFAISSLAYAIGSYSGGQINCAVTLALVVTGHLGAIQGFANFVAQMLGAILGAIILTAMYPEEHDKTGGLGANSVPDGRTFHALVGEFTMTFLLVFVVFETTVNPAAAPNSVVAALAIGFAVFLAHSVLIPLDGCSINPTRSFGPALVRKFIYKNPGSFADHWVFWVGPLLGAVCAAGVSTAMQP